MTLFRVLTLALPAVMALIAAPAMVAAQSGPLKIDITEGVIEPLPIAVPDFIAENGASADYAVQIAQVIASDLVGTGLFREIPHDAFISPISSFNSPVAYADWKAINAQALVTGAVSLGSDGRLAVKFRLFDVFSDSQMGDGLQFAGPAATWRRMAHKVADAIYSRITGEGPYFDSRVVFVSETGPKADRKKRLAIMDYDGANLQYLTDSASLVIAPRFSPTGDRIVYTSYQSGKPEIMLMDVASVAAQSLMQNFEGMSVAPSFSPDGNTAVFSVAQGGNSDLYLIDIASGRQTRLTSAPSIETAPSFSPDGSKIVFESDRSGGQQLYIMSAAGGEPVRISSGAGKYSTPVWSPRGDYIAFTKQNEGRFHIGVMRTDGSEERLLTASFLDEGPTWSPNGRVIMFSRESQGENGAPALFSVDITGRNLRRIATETFASDPSWSPLLP
jgi:TolB protein